MLSIQGKTDRDCLLIKIVRDEYERNVRDERLLNRFIYWFLSLIGKNKKVEMTSNGYFEDDSVIKIYEKMKAKEITAVDNKSLIIASDAVLSANISANCLYVGGVVRGEVKARYLFVKGKIIGNVSVDSLEVFPKGEIEGDVTTAHLYVHKKAKMKGDCVIQ